ncbi:MAG: hypothetical protein P4L28_11330 [Paludibacteraceae bacterium]|nr:hypothetical protein [Paludibacteraceae bacterium]
MKRNIITLGFLFYFILSFAQVPQSFNYQAAVRDNSGNIIANKQVAIRVSILDGSATGTSVYTETFTPTTNQYGIINLAIGTGTTSNSFSAISWSKGQFFLKIELDPAGGTSYTTMGTTQLLSVPFALHAATSATDLHYPDGMINAVSVTQSISTTPFTVPAGKNFYLQAAQQGLKINNDSVRAEYPPFMIVGANKVITGLESGSFISGFYVDATVTPVSTALNNTSYTVPTGKTLVLLNIYDSASATYSASTFKIDGVNINPNGNSSWSYNPLILTSGHVISGKGYINGYLK